MLENGGMKLVRMAMLVLRVLAAGPAMAQQAQPAKSFADQVLAGPAQCPASSTFTTNPPEMPAASLRAREYGTVRVGACVDAQGRAQTVEVLTPAAPSRLKV